MNRKKLFSLILACSFMTSVATPAFAASSNDSVISTSVENTSSSENVALSKQEAVTKGKEILKNCFNINITNKFEYSISLVPSAYSDVKENKFYVWNICWYDNSYNKSTNISISLDANSGKFISMNKSEYSSKEQQRIPNLSYKEAKKIAEDAIKKVNPDKFENSKLVSDRWYSNTYNSSNYSFNYVRCANGAVFNDNYINVNVDGVKGEVTSYYYNWNDNLELPENSDSISLESAKKIFNDNTDMILKYKLFKNKYEYQNKENAKNLKLVYEPTLKNGYMIDANSGEPIQYDGTIKNNAETISPSEDQLNKLYNNYKEIQNFKEPLSKEDASKLISKIIINFYGQGYTLGNLTREEHSTSSDDHLITWTSNFSKKAEVKDKENNSTSTVIRDGSICINALNGQILYLYNYEPYVYKEDFTPKLSWKDGYEKSLEILGANYQDKVKNLELQLSNVELLPPEVSNDKNPKRFYEYSFTRKVNNIPYENNRIYIQLNAETGEISNMSLSWDDTLQFPDPNTALKAEEAKDIYFDKYTPSLEYKLVNTSTDPKSSNKELKLTYFLEPTNSFVEACDGTIINSYDGEKIKFDISDFINEIKGSKAEKEITILAYKGLIDTDDFKLNREVKYMDLIKILVDALGYTPYAIDDKEQSAGVSPEDSANNNRTSLTIDDYLKMAEYYGIISGDLEDLDIEANVSREEMCKSLIKFLQYENIASISNIFSLDIDDAQDISKDNLGYIALAKGLNLIETEDNKLYPKKTATYEDLALGVFRALQNKGADSYYYPMYK